MFRLTRRLWPNDASLRSSSLSLFLWFPLSSRLARACHRLDFVWSLSRPPRPPRPRPSALCSIIIVRVPDLALSPLSPPQHLSLSARHQHQPSPSIAPAAALPQLPQPNPTQPNPTNLYPDPDFGQGLQRGTTPPLPSCYGISPRFKPSCRPTCSTGPPHRPTHSPPGHLASKRPDNTAVSAQLPTISPTPLATHSRLLTIDASAPRARSASPSPPSPRSLRTPPFSPSHLSLSTTPPRPSPPTLLRRLFAKLCATIIVLIRRYDPCIFHLRVLCSICSKVHRRTSIDAQ